MLVQQHYWSVQHRYGARTQTGKNDISNNDAVISLPQADPNLAAADGHNCVQYGPLVFQIALEVPGYGGDARGSHVERAFAWHVPRSDEDVYPEHAARRVTDEPYTVVVVCSGLSAVHHNSHSPTLPHIHPASFP